MAYNASQYVHVDLKRRQPDVDLTCMNLSISAECIYMQSIDVTSSWQSDEFNFEVESYGSWWAHVFRFRVCLWWLLDKIKTILRFLTSSLSWGMQYAPSIDGPSIYWWLSRSHQWDLNGCQSGRYVASWVARHVWCLNNTLKDSQTGTRNCNPDL